MADRLGNIDEHGADNGKLVDESRETKGGTTSDDVPETVDELSCEDAVEHNSLPAENSLGESRQTLHYAQRTKNDAGQTD